MPPTWPTAATARSMCASAASATSSQRRGNPIEPTGRVEVAHGPVAADARDHPAQYRPQVAVDRVLVERLERVDQGIYFDAGRKRFATAADEHEHVATARRRGHVAGLAQ